MVAAHRTENIDFNETNPPVIPGLPMPDELICRQAKRAQKGTKARPEQNKQAAQKIRNRKKAYEKYLKDATEFFTSENTLVQSRLDAGNEYIEELESEAQRLRIQIRDTMAEYMRTEVVEDENDSSRDMYRSALFDTKIPTTRGGKYSHRSSTSSEHRGISTSRIFGSCDEPNTPVHMGIEEPNNYELRIHSKSRVYKPDLDPGVALYQGDRTSCATTNMASSVIISNNPIDCAYGSMCLQNADEESDSGVEDLDDDLGSDVEVDEGAGDLDDVEVVATPISPLTAIDGNNGDIPQRSDAGSSHDMDAGMDMDVDLNGDIEAQIVEDSDDLQSDTEYDGFRYFYIRKSIKPSLIMSRQ
ncbi:hypothetical protein SARC_04135 [Sphaeroforma arctica JP610]|uniref:BZIP domain-containing protein n=1 Tax=Sphaeroforma arctica JP610 TaxID=667725 RepID=A0A0L0G499_9EUKA|nr:hypothetical protein SARC_04135 [Sphaeroforma arctica JP610]KNC83636.1 hypothetical protein SARC_04135 [Sphaeroforma arctica JP610]|eukprot:XP_014157538.1 hypothetical protein SARC_04135 [Sphaeroforma arctica JP610]